MAQISHVLARLKRDPIADLPIASRLEQLLHDQGHAWRDRILTPLVTVRLFLVQILSGNIAVATLNSGFITEISPKGDIVRAVQVPDRYPTNICFGGADMCTAYVTLSDTGRLGVMQWPEPGLKLNFN